jgi:predicted dienelactone hydrolase
MFRNRQWLKVFLEVVMTTASILVMIKPLPVQAAEIITISYGLIEFSISVASLEKFAHEGQIDGEMEGYAHHLNQTQRDQLHQFLTQKIPLSAVDVSQLTYSSFGEKSLSFLGDIIQTGARQNGFYGLRGALILAADSEDFTLINVIKKFPTPQLRVDLIYLLQIIREFNHLFEQNEQAIDLIVQQANQEADSSDTRAAFFPDQPGTLNWNQETLTLFDRQRQRHIITDLYQPNITSPTPLLVISHGLTSNRSDSTFVELAEHLAAHGFTVAVIEHPNSNTQQFQNLLRGLAREVIEPSEITDRPGDVSYLLDELQRRNNSDPWRDRLDLQRIGVIGHSFGGYTALALVGAQLDFANLRHICDSSQFDLSVANVSLTLQCEALKLPEMTYNLRDERIQAAFVFNPIGSALFGEIGLQQIQAPVFMVSGSKDVFAPSLLEQICPFAWLNSPNKYLAIIQGGTHTYTAPTTAQNSVLTVFDSSSVDPALARTYLKYLSLSFFNTYAREQPEYQTFLSSKYAQALSQSPLALYLIRNLSTDQITESINFTCPGTNA